MFKYFPVIAVLFVAVAPLSTYYYASLDPSILLRHTLLTSTLILLLLPYVVGNIVRYNNQLEVNAYLRDILYLQVLPYKWIRQEIHDYLASSSEDKVDTTVFLNRLLEEYKAPRLPPVTSLTVGTRAKLIVNDLLDQDSYQEPCPKHLAKALEEEYTAMYQDEA